MNHTAQHSLPIKKLLSLLVFSAVFFLLPKNADAATFYISPASATIGAGESKTFSIHVNTYGESINAVSAVIAYPSSVAEVTGVTYGSVFNVEAEGSYGKGSIRITRGTTGDIIIANFTVVGKTRGTASFKFASDSQAARTSNSSNALDLANSRGAVLTVSTAGTTSVTTPRQTNPTSVPAQANTTQEVTQAPVVSQQTTNENHVVNVTLKKDNGDVLSFVPVTIQPTGQQGVTDKTGTITFSNIPSGSYTLDATIDKQQQQQDFEVNNTDYAQNITLTMGIKQTKFPLLPLLIVFVAIAVVVGVLYLFLKVRASNQYAGDYEGPSANLMTSKPADKPIEKSEPLDPTNNAS